MQNQFQRKINPNNCEGAFLFKTDFFQRNKEWNNMDGLGVRSNYYFKSKIIQLSEGSKFSNFYFLKTTSDTITPTVEWNFSSANQTHLENFYQPQHSLQSQIREIFVDRGQTWREETRETWPERKLPRRMQGRAKLRMIKMQTREWPRNRGWPGDYYTGSCQCYLSVIWSM